MAFVTHSYIWNRYAAKTIFERQEIILLIEYSITFIVVFVDKLQNRESCMHKCPVHEQQQLFSFPGTGSCPFRLAFIKQLVVVMSFLFVLFYVCRLNLHFLLFLIYFTFLVAHSIKPTSTCFQLLSSSPTQGWAGDRGGVCLLAGGPLDCSQFSIFQCNSRDQAHSLTCGHLGF